MQLDIFGYPVKKAKTTQEAMDYLGITNEPKPVAQPEAKTKYTGEKMVRNEHGVFGLENFVKDNGEEKTQYAGETWVRNENGVFAITSKDKHQLPEDTASGKKERATLKGVETDTFGYPNKKVAPLRDYEIAHAKTNWGKSASENLETIEALKKSSKNHTLRDYEIAHNQTEWAKNAAEFNAKYRALTDEQKQREE